jgi:hypothetical protein
MNLNELLGVTKSDARQRAWAETFNVNMRDEDHIVALGSASRGRGFKDKSVQETYYRKLEKYAPAMGELVIDGYIQRMETMCRISTKADNQSIAQLNHHIANLKSVLFVLKEIKGMENKCIKLYNILNRIFSLRDNTPYKPVSIFHNVIL